LKGIAKSTNNIKNKPRTRTTMAPGRKVKATSDKDESNHKINEYLSRNEDKGARIANISDATKRAKTNEGDLLIMAKPRGKEIKWKRGKF